jgi:molybdopterin-guanine dinucleotide biosynthesis protein A
MAGVLLTGGASRRMGADKARLVVAGETLAVRSARVLGEVCDPVIEVGPGVSGLPAIEEDPRGAGPLVALLAGVGALGNPRAVVLLACDLPFVEPALLQMLVEYPGWGSVVPVVDGRFQFACARYGRAAYAEAKVMLRVGESSLRAISGADCSYLNESAWGEVVTARAFADVDTPDDWERLGLT